MRVALVLPSCVPLRRYLAVVTTGFTDERVRAWVAAAPLRWPRWVLAGLWVAAFVVSTMSDTAPCSTASPCGPEPDFSVALVLCLGALALLWWRPFVAAACAVVFAVLDLAFDDVVTARVAWPVVALAFVAYAVHVRSRTQRQRDIARAASVVLPPWPAGLQRPLRTDRPHRLMALAAMVLVLVATGSVFGYERATGLDAEHSARSRVVEGVVLGHEDDEGYQRVQLTDRPEGFPAVVDVSFVDVPEVGTDVAVQVDPQDPSWAHAIAEPPDRTWWFTLGLGALLVAGLLGERLLSVRVRRRHLEASSHQVGVPVRVFTDDLDFVGIVATDSTRGLAQFPVDENLRLARAEDRRVAAPVETYLVGDVRHGGWAALASPTGLRLPMGAISALPEGTEVDLDSFDRDPEDVSDWSEEVPMGTIPVPLPVTVEAPLWRRLAGALVAVAAVAVGTWLLRDDEVGFSGIGVVVGTGSAMHWGLDQLAHRIRVTRSGFEMSTVFRRMSSPMGAVREVRHDGEAALVVFDDESVLDITPGDGDHRGLAAAIEHAVASAPRLPRNAVPTAGQLAWTAVAFGLGVVVLAGSWLVHWLG